MPSRRDSTAALAFLETSEATGGARTLLEVELAPGRGTMPHRHLTRPVRLEVLEGSLSLQIGREVLRLEAGESATAPATVTYRVANRSGVPARFRIELTPGHEGFEQAVRVGRGLARDGLVRRDGAPRRLYHLAVLAQWSEIEVSGPLAALAPLLGPVARDARSKGVDRELLERYAGQETYAENDRLRTAGT